MKVATWNVNSLSARWPRVSAWLSENEPDIALLQETKQTDEKFPFGGLRELGYESSHYGEGRWNGVAILSKVGLENVSRGFGDDDEEARLIGARCAGLQVYSCYVPNGRSLDHDHYQYKLRWLASLAQTLASRDPEVHVVVGGDFNVAPSDLDVYDPSAFVGMTHVSEPERDALRVLESGDSSISPGDSTPMRRSTRGGTIATARFTGAGDCASICSWSIRRWPSWPRRVTSIETRERARNLPTTHRWSGSSISSADPSAGRLR